MPTDRRPGKAVRLVATGRVPAAVVAAPGLLAPQHR